MPNEREKEREEGKKKGKRKLKFDPLVISSVENQKDLGRPLALEVDTPAKNP